MNMKKSLLLLGATCAFLTTNAQTQLFFEDFEGASSFTLNSNDVSSTTSGYNSWVINNSYTGGSGISSCFGFSFTIGNTPSQPGGISSANGNYAHILSDDAVSNNIFNSSFAASDGGALCFGDENYFMKMTNDISTVGQSSVSIDFWWTCTGGPDSYGQLYYSTDGGSTWVQETTVSQYNNNGTWTNEVISDPAWAGQATLRFGFRFVNLAAFSGASDPALAIDDFEILGSAGCTNTSASISETVCDSYTVPSGDETYTTPGTTTVMDTIPNAAGCDSIITISLAINTVDPAVTDNGDGTLTANTGGASYQWLEDCNTTPTEIAGATAQTLSPGADGFYSCIVTHLGCTDTSACTQIMFFSIDEYGKAISMYPNPTNGELTIDMTELSGQHQLSITDINGKLVLTQNIQGNSIQQLSLDIESGVYIVSLLGEDGIISRSRLIVER